MQYNPSVYCLRFLFVLLLFQCPSKADTSSPSIQFVQPVQVNILLWSLMIEDTEAVFYNRLFLLESPYLPFLQTTAPLTPLMTDCLTYLEEVEEATGTSFPVFPICLEARSLAKEEANQVTRLQDHQDQDPPMVLQQLDHHTRLLLQITGNTNFSSIATMNTNRCTKATIKQLWSSTSPPSWLRSTTSASHWIWSTSGSCHQWKLQSTLIHVLYNSSEQQQQQQ